MARRLTTIIPQSRDSRFDPWLGHFCPLGHAFCIPHAFGAVWGGLGAFGLSLVGLVRILMIFLLCRIEGRGGVCSCRSGQVWEARGCWVWLGAVLGECVEVLSFCCFLPDLTSSSLSSSVLRVLRYPCRRSTSLSSSW